MQMHFDGVLKNLLIVFSILLLPVVNYSNPVSSGGSGKDKSIIGDSGVFGNLNNNVALVTDEGALVVTTYTHEQDIFIQYEAFDIDATTYNILIDLSDTINFNHTVTDVLDITFINIEVDRDASAVGQIEIGVITRIDGTDADIVYFVELSFLKSNDRHLDQILHYAPSQMNCTVTAGVLVAILSNQFENDVTEVNTGELLNSPLGTGSVTPDVGDIIIKATRSAGTYDFSIGIFYHTEL